MEGAREPEQKDRFPTCPGAYYTVLLGKSFYLGLSFLICNNYKQNHHFIQQRGTVVQRLNKITAVTASTIP